MGCESYRTMRYSKARKSYEYRGSNIVNGLKKYTRRFMELQTLFTVHKRIICDRGNLQRSLAKASSYSSNRQVSFITEKGERVISTISNFNESKLIHYIGSLERLITSYKKIKSTKGNLIKDIHKETLDGISLE